MDNSPQTPPSRNQPPAELVPPLRGYDSADQLRGALEAVLISAIGAPVARDVAALLVDQACFDTC